ncbi:multiprotein-bridging factor 1 family protein [Streptomyces sp. NPDC057638]|uniref:helix-turn-helix domain-containing protein n=1 Tax=Streptomyces sp. NPDC057638 TaxID=3346190 RepID=UPI003678066A
MNGNRTLRAARVERGWSSQEQAAEAISATGQQVLNDPSFYVSERTYRRWESDRPGWPRADAATVLRHVFGRAPHHLGFTPPPGHPAHDDPQQEDPVNRRTFLAAGSVAALAITEPVHAAALTTRRIDPKLSDYFAQQLSAHYTADTLLGPAELIGTVTEQYRVISTVAQAANGTVRDDLVRVGAAYAVLAGWLHQDAGQWSAARSWHSAALADAHRVDDPDLHGYTLANLGYLHVELGDGRSSVALCQRGLDHRSMPPVARMQLLYQQAHGHSLLGDRDAVERLLDEAQHLAAAAPETPPTPWRRTAATAAANPRFFDIQRATAYGRLHLYAEAQALWEPVTTSLPPAARRRAGIYLARQATAHAALGDADRALALVTESAQLAAETKSARHVAELQSLRDDMSVGANTPLYRELDHALRTLPA